MKIKRTLLDILAGCGLYVLLPFIGMIVSGTRHVHIPENNWDALDITMLVVWLPAFFGLAFMIILWPWMFNDCSKKASSYERSKWLKLMVFFGWVGAIFYYFIIYRREQEIAGQRRLEVVKLPTKILRRE